MSEKNFGRLVLMFFAALLFSDFQMFAKDCVDKVKDTEWCVEGIKLENYRFSSRESNMELNLNSAPFMLEGKTSFIATAPLWNVTVKTEKKIPYEMITIAGYYPPKYSYPWIAIISVTTKERKQEIERQIETAQERFVQNCFGCAELGVRDPGTGLSKKSR